MAQTARRVETGGRRGEMLDLSGWVAVAVGIVAVAATLLLPAADGQAARGDHGDCAGRLMATATMHSTTE